MASGSDQFIVDDKGRKKGVVLSFSRDQKLMEDLHDLAVVAERRSKKPVNLIEVERRLKLVSCHRRI